MISLAYAQDAAQAAPEGALGVFGGFLPMIIIFVIFYLLLIRPQQKQQKLHKQMISETKRGDEIITSSGIHGKVTEVQDDSVKVEIAKDVEVKLDKNFIQSIKGYTPNQK